MPEPSLPTSSSSSPTEALRCSLAWQLTIMKPGWESREDGWMSSNRRPVSASLHPSLCRSTPRLQPLSEVSQPPPPHATTLLRSGRRCGRPSGTYLSGSSPGSCSTLRQSIPISKTTNRPPAGSCSLRLSAWSKQDVCSNTGQRIVFYLWGILWFFGSSTLRHPDLSWSFFTVTTMKT